MSGILWRILFAVIAVVLFWQLLPPLTRIFGFDLSADVLMVLRVIVAGLAIYYVLSGPTPPWKRP